MEQLAIADADSKDHLPELLRAGHSARRPDSVMILVGCRPIDLRDQDRFADMPGLDHGRRPVSRLVVVDASDRATLANYFTLD